MEQKVKHLSPKILHSMHVGEAGLASINRRGHVAARVVIGFVIKCAVVFLVSSLHFFWTGQLVCNFGVFGASLSCWLFGSVLRTYLLLHRTGTDFFQHCFP